MKKINSNNKKPKHLKPCSICKERTYELKFYTTCTKKKQILELCKRCVKDMQWTRSCLAAAHGMFKNKTSNILKKTIKE